SDMVSWGSIGARTAASQVHRQLSSGLSMPIGIKNGTDGNVQVAVDAARAAANQHVFTGITEDGVAAILSTLGNPDCHVILRGSESGPNYHPENVADTLRRLAKAGLPERVIIDASHGNSGKQPERQPAIVREIADRLAAGERGIVGLMLESFLVAGRQELVLGQADRLRYGQSITDGCVDWDTTERVLRQLAVTGSARRPGRDGSAWPRCWAGCWARCCCSPCRPARSPRSCRCSSGCPWCWSSRNPGWPGGWPPGGRPSRTAGATSSRTGR